MLKFTRFTKRANPQFKKSSKDRRTSNTRKSRSPKYFTPEIFRRQLMDMIKTYAHLRTAAGMQIHITLHRGSRKRRTLLGATTTRPHTNFKNGFIKVWSETARDRLRRIPGNSRRARVPRFNSAIPKAPRV